MLFNVFSTEVLRTFKKDSLENLLGILWFISWFSLFSHQTVPLPFSLQVCTYVSTNLLQMNSRLLRNPWILAQSNAKWRPKTAQGIKMFGKYVLMWGWYSRMQWNITMIEMMSMLWPNLCWKDLRQNGCNFCQKLMKRFWCSLESLQIASTADKCGVLRLPSLINNLYADNKRTNSVALLQI